MRGRGAPCPSELGVASPRIIIDPGKGFWRKSLLCNFADRLRVLLALLALCKAITPAPTLGERDQCQILFQGSLGS